MIKTLTAKVNQLVQNGIFFNPHECGHRHHFSSTGSRTGHQFIVTVITITIIINISTIAITGTNQVRWYRDSNLLAETDTVSFQTQQNRHTLILRLVNSLFNNFIDIVFAIVIVLPNPAESTHTHSEVSPNDHIDIAIAK